MKRPILILVSILMLASLACSVTLNLPTAKTGDTQSMTISEPTTDAKPSELVLRMGGGKLDVTSGSSQLVDGTVRYNVEDWKPTITREGQEVRIEQSVKGSIPVGDNIINDWELKLGKDPIDLTVEAGAYEGNIDLTGVPIVRLKITDGAGSSKLIFDQPNPVRMDSLTYETGASNITLEGLGNSDADVVNFKGGAGNFSLDFTGQLKRDMRVYVDGGLGNITITVPSSTNARIIMSTSLNTISTKGSWTVDNNEYRTNGQGPLLRIEVKVGIGNLNLVSK
ncbi:MAG TPA: toast rack family protein [Anaerolinea sp.]|nr:toast rack family protein [Anaerolinea sp.]